MNAPEHLTINEDKGTADCTVCKTSATFPESFGAIPRSDLLASFFVQHAVHTQRGVPSGLTAAGKPTKAARAVLEPYIEEQTQ